MAYAQLRYAGEIVGLHRVMGHGDHLDDGIMFLLMAGIVEHVKTTRPDIHYVFYGMFFGASEGLRASRCTWASGLTTCAGSASSRRLT